MSLEMVPWAMAAIVAVSMPTMASAGVAEDWLAGKVQPGGALITYAGPPIEMKYGHPSPPVSIFVPPTEQNLVRIKNATNGKLNFKEYGSGALFDAKGGFKGVRSNVGEWGTCYPIYEGRGMPLSRVWELPYVTSPNAMASVRVAQELAAKYFVPEFKKQGVAWGMFMAFNPSDLLSKKPIRSVEDMRGLKVAAQGFSPEVAKALGVTVVNLSYPELYNALQQGVIDAVFWADLGFVPYRLYEVAKYHTTLGLTGGGAWTCYNKDAIKSLPADLQQVFVQGLEPFAMAAVKATQIDFSKTARDAYSSHGVEMITLPKEEQLKLQRAVAPVQERWVESLVKEGLPAKQLLDDIRKLNARYQGMSPDELMRLSIEHPVQGVQ